MVKTVLLQVEEAIVAVNVLVFHQVYDFGGVLVDIYDALKLKLDLVFHVVTGVLGVAKLQLDIIYQFVESQSNSQRIDVLSKDTVLCWLTENFLEDLHNLLSLQFLHEGF